MKRSRENIVFKDYIKNASKYVLVFLGTSSIFFLISRLYNLEIEGFIYPFLILFSVMIVILLVTGLKNKKEAKERYHRLKGIKEVKVKFTKSKSLLEKDYQDMVISLQDEIEELNKQNDTFEKDLEDYYTNWVHQIKTPIAVLKLKLNEEESSNVELKEELFRIEQYVEMALQNIRLNSKTNDLVFNEYSLDELIRESIRKHSSQFILKKIALNYQGTSIKVITDKKWFQLILDQAISNAIKYTTKGSVSIQVEDDFLKITDTGIGISKEDIPMIFERGYTGINGRVEKHSSGLGLYLSKKASEKINTKISIDSTPKKGTTFNIDLGKVIVK